MSEIPITWYELDREATKPRLPRWKRLAGRADDGTIWLPGAVVKGGENVAFLCASYDGTPCVMLDHHAYYPASWLAREFPDLAELCATIERRLREAESAA